MERTLKPFLPWLGQAVKFGTVGLRNTALDLGLYFLLTRWVGLAAVFAKSISYGVGILNSFYWNRSWTFRSKASARSTLLPFILINLVGLAINTGVMQFCLKGLQAPEIIALGLATAGTLAWNFTASKLLIFK